MRNAKFPSVMEQPPSGTARFTLAFFGALAGSIFVWYCLSAYAHSHLATLNVSSVADMAVLVFREGLECVLVLAAITAGSAEDNRFLIKPVLAGVGAGLLATIATWIVAVRIISDLGESISALALQAATGLLAVVVLLVVMNWFFHKMYWTGWISLHSKRKRNLVENASGEQSKSRLFWGMALLGFTSFYREGFEVVLFLQGYRLRLGGEAVFQGLAAGLFLTSIVAVLTFVVHRRLPYRKMLVLTGALLGIVLIVMVGEQAQEMQLAHWITTTRITSLERLIPDWMGLWFSIFPTVESLLAQAVSAALVLGSYFIAGRGTAVRDRVNEPMRVG